MGARYGGFAIAVALALTPLTVSAEPRPTKPQVGDVYEIRRDKETSSKSSGGSAGISSTGSSHDEDVLIERVMVVNETGLELEYDLPETVTKQDREREWQFPVRVFRPLRGSPRLLNQLELEKRRDGWMKAAELAPDLCGRYYITWNAFRIECDPQSVLQTLAAFDLGPDDPHEGSLYRDVDVPSPALLKRTKSGPRGATFVAEMSVDPDAVRRGRAEADVVVAELMKKPVSLETALRTHSDEEVTGVVTVTLEVDPAGRAQRLTKVATMQIKGAGGKVEDKTATVVLERRLVAHH